MGGVVSGRWASRGGGALADPAADPRRRPRRPRPQADRRRRLAAGAARAGGAGAGCQNGRGRARQGPLRRHRRAGFRRRPRQGEGGAARSNLRRRLRRIRTAHAAADPHLPASRRLRGTGRREGEAGKTVTSRLAGAARRRPNAGCAPSSPPPPRNSAGPRRSPARAAGSPAISSSRAPRRTGRPAGWRNCDGGCAPCGRTDPAGELVFFLHDEVMVHCPDGAVDDSIRAIEEAATPPRSCCSAGSRWNSRSASRSSTPTITPITHRRRPP